MHLLEGQGTKIIEKKNLDYREMKSSKEYRIQLKEPSCLTTDISKNVLVLRMPFEAMSGATQ